MWYGSGTTTFGVSSLVYPGHIISAEGVRPDLEKIIAVRDWPTPKSVRQVRTFLGLTGYYRRFIARYAQVAAPLTDLLRKDSFRWDVTTETAFDALKARLTSTPLLAYPDFSLPFIIETDTCEVGIGAILLQKEHPIAYYSKKLSPLRQRSSTYAKELWAITDVVQKWRHYLCGGKFVTRTNH